MSYQENDGEQKPAEAAPENENADKPEDRGAVDEGQQPADDQRSGEPSTSLPESEGAEKAPEEGEKQEGEGE